MGVSQIIQNHTIFRLKQSWWLGDPPFWEPQILSKYRSADDPPKKSAWVPKFPVLGPFIRVWPKRIPKQFLLWNIGAFCPADVGLQGANVCQDPMGGLQPDPLRPPVQAWWNQPKITWMEGVYQEFVFHTIWIPLNCIFLTAQLGSLGTLGSISSIPTSTRIGSHRSTIPGKEKRASDAWILRGKCSMFERPNGWTAASGLEDSAGGCFTMKFPIEQTHAITHSIFLSWSIVPSIFFLKNQHWTQI